MQAQNEFTSLKLLTIKTTGVVKKKTGPHQIYNIHFKHFSRGAHLTLCEGQLIYSIKNRDGILNGKHS